MSISLSLDRQFRKKVDWAENIAHLQQIQQKVFLAQGSVILTWQLNPSWYLRPLSHRDPLFMSMAYGIYIIHHLLLNSIN